MKMVEIQDFRFLENAQFWRNFSSAVPTFFICTSLIIAGICKLEFHFMELFMKEKINNKCEKKYTSCDGQY